MYPDMSANKILRKLNESKGKMCTFIFLDNYNKYQQLKMLLLNQGFDEYVDFLDATLFLTERHGFKRNFNTRQLVQEL